MEYYVESELCNDDDDLVQQVPQPPPAQHSEGGDDDAGPEQVHQVQEWCPPCHTGVTD